MSVHHKNSKQNRREQRKTLRAQRQLEAAYHGTGRWTHSEPAIQNLPRGKPSSLAQELKEAFLRLIRMDRR
jgi:hypothetical protein